MIAIVVEIHRSDKQVAVSARITILVVLQRVDAALAIIAAHADAQPWNTIIIYTQNTCITIGDVKFVRARTTSMDPVFCAEEVCLKAWQKLHLIAPILHASPKADACLMPCARQDGVLSLWTIDSEELIGHMMLIGTTDRNDDVSHP